ncbi:hypothetical protein [Salinarimonas chemoclinalis]|uniref:hypothetical protein n=1 Tax=Salinarimonas chemoclinalis TaxID=3241599 RepID=UPI003557819F
MRRFPSRPVAFRTAATIVAGFTALVSLAGAAEARMLRYDCLELVAPVCSQIRDVDAAHRCVVHETHACEARLGSQGQGWSHGHPIPTAYHHGDPGAGPGGDPGGPGGDPGVPGGDPGVPGGDPGTPNGDPGGPEGGRDRR